MLNRPRSVDQALDEAVVMDVVFTLDARAITRAKPSNNAPGSGGGGSFEYQQTVRLRKHSAWPAAYSPFVALIGGEREIEAADDDPEQQQHKPKEAEAGLNRMLAAPDTPITGALPDRLVNTV